MPDIYDFSGWATRSNVLCTDGRTILPNAFADNDGMTVPLVWNHQHNAPEDVLGHALLESRDGDVYAYCRFNTTESGKAAKQLVDHGDVCSLSIYANALKQNGKNVVHGNIREVSLVLAGANPLAKIENVSMAHGDGDDVEIEEAIIYHGEDSIELFHAEEKKEEDSKVAEEPKKTDESADDKTIKDVFETLNEEQKTAVYAIIATAMAEAEDDESEDETVKHNVFEQDQKDQTTYLSHSDMENIFRDAKSCGSLAEAVRKYAEDGVLVHTDTEGMVTPTGHSTYGINDMSMLFPDYKNLTDTPQFISRDMGWVQKVMNSVHHTPFSRIKSLFADLTADEARARGYVKGSLKTDEVITTLKRTTDPQTVYKRQKFDRDDVIDITDFDVVAWIRREMRVMLDEELARAFLIGDGRTGSSPDKISADHIRPVVLDVPLFNTKVKVSVAHNADASDIAKETIKAAIRARKNYKGSGNPTFYTTEDAVTEMLLLEDSIGHRLYKTMDELATALRVKEIVTVEPMENYVVPITVTSGGTSSTTEYPLIGTIVNMADYNVGADKGGQVSMFDDFDIDYNREKYLIETRCSGALTKPYSALTLVLDQATE